MNVNFGGRTKRGLGVVPDRSSSAALMALRGGSAATGRGDARENGKRRPLGVLGVLGALVVVASGASVTGRGRGLNGRLPLATLADV